MGGYTGQSEVSVSQGIRMMFYVLHPNETSFKTIEEVPDYVEKATAYFFIMLILEMIISWAWKGKPLRVNDGLTSLSAGVMSRLPDVVFRGVEVTTYIYVWNHYRLVELPWESPWIWWLTFLGVDFGYYWFHRMAHDISLVERCNPYLNLIVVYTWGSWCFYCSCILRKIKRTDKRQVIYKETV